LPWQTPGVEVLGLAYLVLTMVEGAALVDDG
jgi:hypothetical protein